MRVIRTIKRSDDMPLFGKVLRVRKGVYQVVIKFTASRRVYHAEDIKASSVKLVKQFFAREYPTLTWGKPKHPRTKVKARVSAKPRVRKKESK